MSYVSGFPLPNTWDSEALRILPDLAAVPPGGAYWLALVRPMQSVLDDYALLYAGQVDIGDAAGFGLDLAGDIAGVSRMGLSDDEYRRIIAAARIVRGGRVSQQRCRAAWVALTEDESATLKVPGDYSVHLAAKVSFVPSSTFLTVAGKVVKGSVPAAYDVEALISPLDGARYDDATYGYDTGDYAWSVRV